YKNACILTWSYTSLPKRRPVAVPADWTRERAEGGQTIRNKTQQQHDEPASPAESPAAPDAAALLAPQAEQPSEVPEPEIADSAAPAFALAAVPADESDHTQKNDAEAQSHTEAQEGA